MSELNEKRLLGIIRKQKVALDRRAFTSEFFNEELTDILKKAFKSQPEYKHGVKAAPKERIVNILLSDLHFGADLDPQEVPVGYGKLEERRRMAYLARELIEYKPHYRENTHACVHLAGDIIQGRLHDLASGAPLQEQVARAMYLLGNFLGVLKTHYPSVEVYCTPGNHGRIKDRHHGQAVDQKWDSFENIIYESLKLMHPDIKFTIPRTPFYEYTQFGMKGFVTHGDTVLRPGNPGKSINVGRLEEQILKLADARSKYDLVAVGHVHVPSVTNLPSAVLVTNGCLIPPDPYCLSIGLHANVCVQQLWETVPGFMFGDHRMLLLNSKVDKDKSLDKIIKPQ